MTVLGQTTVRAYSTASGWEVGIFFLILAFYLSFLLWAIYTREDDIDVAIRASFKGDVDPDDITAALDFPRKQARTGKAIRGEK